LVQWRRKIKLMEVNENVVIKKIDLKRTLRQVFIRVYRLEIAHFWRTSSHVGILPSFVICTMYSPLLRTLKSWRRVLQHHLALISDTAGSLGLELRTLRSWRSVLQHHLALISDTAGSLRLELRTLKSWTERITAPSSVNF
jgi:hypothetical protein